MAEGDQLTKRQFCRSCCGWVRFRQAFPAISAILSPKPCPLRFHRPEHASQELVAWQSASRYCCVLREESAWPDRWVVSPEAANAARLSIIAAFYLAMRARTAFGRETNVAILVCSTAQYIRPESIANEEACAREADLLASVFQQPCR